MVPVGISDTKKIYLNNKNSTNVCEAIAITPEDTHTHKKELETIKTKTEKPLGQIFDAVATCFTKKPFIPFEEFKDWPLTIERTREISTDMCIQFKKLPDYYATNIPMIQKHFQNYKCKSEITKNDEGFVIVDGTAYRKSELHLETLKIEPQAIQNEKSIPTYQEPIKTSPQPILEEKTEKVLKDEKHQIEVSATRDEEIVKKASNFFASLNFNVTGPEKKPIGRLSRPIQNDPLTIAFNQMREMDRAINED